MLPGVPGPGPGLPPDSAQVGGRPLHQTVPTPGGLRQHQGRDGGDHWDQSCVVRHNNKVTFTLASLNCLWQAESCSWCFSTISRIAWLSSRSKVSRPTVSSLLILPRIVSKCLRTDQKFWLHKGSDGFIFLPRTFCSSISLNVEHKGKSWTIWRISTAFLVSSLLILADSVISTFLWKNKCRGQNLDKK